MAQAPALEYLFSLSAQLQAPHTVGDCGRGNRLIVHVTEGTVEGPRLTGRLLPGGGDWLIVRPDGVGEIDVRVTVEATDGALLYVSYRGYLTNLGEVLPRWGAGEDVPRDRYYFATAPLVETGASQYAWLTRTVCVGVGALIRGGVSYDVFGVPA
jgi:hypothetical protein